MAKSDATDSATTGVGSTSALGIRFQSDVKHSLTHPHWKYYWTQQNQNPEAGQTSMGRGWQIFMYTIPDYLRDHSRVWCFIKGLPFNTLIRADIEGVPEHYATRIQLLSWLWFHESFQGLYNMYYTKYGTNQTQSTSGGGSSSGVSRDPYARLLHGLNQHKKKKSRGDPTMSSEYEQYLKTDFVSGTSAQGFAFLMYLGFWKSKEKSVSCSSRYGLDILSVQASSVASESAFSTVVDVEEGVFNDEVQQNEATQLTDQEIALDASSDGSLSSGERRRDYMMSSERRDDIRRGRRLCHMVKLTIVLKKNDTNKSATSNSVVSCHKDQSTGLSNPFIDDQYKRLMALNSEKSGSSSMHANIAGEQTSKNLGDVVVVGADDQGQMGGGKFEFLTREEDTRLDLISILHKS
ncbi:zinc finger BED domain-containing protein RICESLEEPER 2 [Tanacetum coccineum]